MAVSERKSANERRDEILEAALVEFAARGLDGGSTETIAKAVGISQPYVFRLFGTKKQLFIATVERCLRGTLEMMHTSSAGATATSSSTSSASRACRASASRTSSPRECSST